MYAYGFASQITGWSHHGETIDFTHDAAGQLTSADYLLQADEEFAFDANGNRTGGAMVIGDNNQVLSDGTYDYQYDSEGNLILETEIASGDYVEYEYDHRNRLVLATSYSVGSAVLQVVEFTYDLFDRRIAKAVDAASVYTVYHGDHAWADFDETGDVLARYLFGDQIDEIIARWTPGEGTAWYLTDHLGSVRDLVDNAGNLINTITYDSFGGIVVQTNLAAGDRFTYTGREYDAEIDLYYYRARFYDANLGRFVSQDPIGFAAGDPNLYRYVGNAPTSLKDPSGLFVETAMAATWAGIASVPGSLGNMAVGAGNAAMEVGYYAVDVAGVGFDAVATYAGYSIGYEEMSSIGRSNQPSSPEFVQNAAANALRAGLAGGTAGGSEIGFGIADFAATGDAVALQNHMGGVAAGNLAGSLGVKLGSLSGIVGKLSSLGGSVGGLLKGLLEKNPAGKCTGTQGTPSNTGAYVKSKAPAVQRTLPKDKNGILQPDVDSPHTQLGRSTRSHGAEPQAREWMQDSQGRLVPTKDIDFTDHGFPAIHPNPHQHTLTPANPSNPIGGGFHRSAPEPLR